MELDIGDPVEVRKLSFEKGEEWVPATVVYVSEYQVGVAYASGVREALPRNKMWYRRKEND